MALKTQYQPYGLPGKIRTFVAKTAAPTGVKSVFRRLRRMRDVLGRGRYFGV